MSQQHKEIPVEPARTNGLAHAHRATVSPPPGIGTQEAIREQVGRILASTLFRGSKRLSSLLTFTVERVLKGETTRLKERTLGVEVFGREHNYDTTQDPVVRMTAVEIRKRLTQYYGTPEHTGELRVEFPVGSYVPEFHAAPEPPADLEPITPRRVAWKPAAASLMAGIICGLLWWGIRTRQDAFELFWAPILHHSKVPVLLCLGEARITTTEPTGIEPISTRDSIRSDTTITELLQRDSVRFSDALSLAMLTGVLQARHRNYHIRRTQSIALDDLRDGPAILIGLMNNPWSRLLGRELRFSIAQDSGRLYIRDRQNPSNRAWGYDGVATPLAQIAESHGFVSRVMDPTTGHFLVTVAGLLWGTKAATECLTQPACLEEAHQLAPGDWKHKNIQIVIHAKVVGKNSGPPHVVAVHLW